MGGNRVLYGCTVASRNFLAHARVLAESFLSRNPGARFFVLIVDRPHAPLPSDEPFEALSPADVDVEEDELHRRGVMYSTQGLAASMKSQLLASLLARGDGPVLYLDADSRVYDSLSNVGALAQQHSLLLSPHTLDPHPLWREDGPEQTILRAGVMNAGLIGVGQGAEGFLDWWGQRTRRRCVFDLDRALMLAQTWLTFAVGLFEHHVLRDRGCNVAGWNLQSRDVQWRDGVAWIDQTPLRHFHFAGSFDPRRPHLITPVELHQRWWPSLDRRPGTAALVREYADRLMQQGYAELCGRPGPYDATPAGVRITPWMRERYRTAVIDSEAGSAQEPPNPFLADEQDFHDWMRAQAGEAIAQATPGRSSAEAQALTQALSDGGRMLARIAELEQIRDDAIGWAQRVSSELEVVCADLQAERERSAAGMRQVQASANWRIAGPLRKLRAALRRRVAAGAREGA